VNKNAFTLIEVLVSVVILSSVAVILFEISTNAKSNYTFLKDKSDFSTLSSVALTHSNQKYHNKNMNLYEFIKYDYKIKDDDLRKYLKSKKINYEHEEFSTFSPFSEGDADTLKTQDNNIAEMVNFTLVFDRVKIWTKEQSSYIYKIYMRQ
jgi:prepilin-type N-terminal cleavage/methylation domain-containing protein